MTDEELLEIEKRAQAAMPGPWRWNLSLKSKHMNLESLGCEHSRLEVVMDFVRWGMGGAKARFQNSGNHLMVDADLLAIPVKGREHHSDWFREIGHPDAVFIAHARKDVQDLLLEVRKLKEEKLSLLAQVRGQKYGDSET